MNIGWGFRLWKLSRPERARCTANATASAAAATTTAGRVAEILHGHLPGEATGRRRDEGRH